MYWFKLKDLVGKERLHTAAAVLSRPILPVVDRKRSARLAGAQQASTTALKGSRRRKRAAPHNQDWRPNAKADRPKNRTYIMLRLNKFVASGDYAGERDPPRIVRIIQVCKRATEWYENVHWRQAVSGEDYRERLTNNFKELEDGVISCLPPRVIENAVPQLSVPFIVDKLKEFAVSSTHKELDRIQSEFTTQDGATVIPHETQTSQGLQGEYDLSLLKAELWRVAGKRACRRALRSAYHPGYALSVDDPGLLGCPSLALSDLLRLSRDPECQRYHETKR